MAPFLTRISPAVDGSVAYLGTPEDLVQSERLYVASGSDLAAVGPDSSMALSFGWFPDGEQLLLLVSDAGIDPEPAVLRVVSADGETDTEFPIDRELTSGFGFIDVDSARGRAYFAGSTPTVLGSPTDLYWLDLESGQVTQITDTPRFERYPVMVDENRIAYVGLGVEVIDTTTGEVTTLSGDDQDVGGIDLTSSRDWVIYDAYEGNDRTTNAIWYVAVDGSSPPVRMLQTDGLWVSISNDGKHILVTHPVGSLEWLEVPDNAPWLAG